jgi:hypothetical protein
MRRRFVTAEADQNLHCMQTKVAYFQARKIFLLVLSLYSPMAKKQQQVA